MLLWTPYAISAFVRSFTPLQLPENFHLISSLIAKTSLIWTALFFIATDGSIRNYFNRKYEENQSPLSQSIKGMRLKPIYIKTKSSDESKRQSLSLINRDSDDSKNKVTNLIGIGDTKKINSDFYYKTSGLPIIIFSDITVENEE